MFGNQPMSMTNPPPAHAITKGILKLARQIEATQVPGFVAVEPGENCRPDCSYENVRAMVRQRGGSIQPGWRLREQATAYVEGALHAVWRGPDGSLVDITPRTDGETHIIFLSDSKVRWEGEATEPRRMMLHMQSCYCGSGLPFKICHGQGDE
jgi:hypothetical protein